MSVSRPYCGKNETQMFPEVRFNRTVVEPAVEAQLEECLVSFTRQSRAFRTANSSKSEQAARYQITFSGGGSACYEQY